jgi:hypothetical protein
VAAFRAALVLDIREHRLAWSTILAGLLASVMLWGSILGVPLARPAAFEMAAPSSVPVVEHLIEFGPPE